MLNAINSNKYKNDFEFVSLQQFSKIEEEEEEEKEKEKEEKEEKEVKFNLYE
jgi:hypothetical protein